MCDTFCKVHQSVVEEEEEVAEVVGDWEANTHPTPMMMAKAIREAQLIVDQTLKAPDLNPMGQDPLGSLLAHLVQTLPAQWELGDLTLALTGTNSPQHTAC